MMQNLIPDVWDTDILYDTAEVDELIQKYSTIYENADTETAWDGTLGYGCIVLTAYNAPVVVIQEVALNEWSSAHKVSAYPNMEDIPEEVLVAIDENAIEEVA